MRFDHAEIHDDALDLHLRDDHYPLRLTLHYRLHPEYDLIERSASLTNEGEAPITLERVLSAQWHPPQQQRYRLSHLTGRWSDEFNLHRDWLPHGVTRLESRRLTTSH
ncbi:MAG: alpha-galactosidase, partial [Anaerolineae bacterium]|nr:alpha-galactosidase [Anaerolineae bacterium]